MDVLITVLESTWAILMLFCMQITVDDAKWQASQNIEHSMTRKQGGG